MDLVEREIGTMLAGEFFDSVERNLGRIVQVIDDHRLVASEKQLQHRVGTNVPSTTSD